ncbi:MAG TPA: SRPBCC family protein [Streptosporangiaceae bacterium]
MEEVQLRPADKLAWHEEQTAIPLPPEEVYARLNGAPLEGLIPGTGRIPAVVGTAALNDIPFPHPGARRRVMLADGNTATEEVIQNTPGGYFSYKVWGYTLSTARPIRYGKGEFWYLPADESRATTLRWRYSFKLRGDRFPGMLGPFGRFVFTKVFLDRAYATFMKSAMNAIERYALQSAERQPGQTIHAYHDEAHNPGNEPSTS